ncbi:hypothetical protein C8F01DRAFT_1125631 [Mycena amicta]|nr:hypothetical protein C8F01DRAFT_1125631 [Mycena amicta]
MSCPDSESVPALKLPPELERIIFELAATELPKSILTLSLVACRVKEWLDPILFRTLVITSNAPHRARDDFLSCRIDVFQAIARQKPSLLKNTVRNVIFVYLSRQEQEIVFTACPSLENICIDSNLEGWDLQSGTALARLEHLSHLSIGVQDLFSRLKQIHPGPHPCFVHITHIQLIANTLGPPGSAAAQRWRAFAELPNLTHVVARGLWARDILFLLASCTMLRALILEIYSTNTSLLAEYEEACKDVRFVLYLSSEGIQQGWLDALRGKEIFWDRAERLIAQRGTAEFSGAPVLDERTELPDYDWLS